MPTMFDSHDEFNEWFSKDIENHAERQSGIDAGNNKDLFAFAGLVHLEDLKYLSCWVCGTYFDWLIYDYHVGGGGGYGFMCIFEWS